MEQLEKSGLHEHRELISLSKLIPVFSVTVASSLINPITKLIASLGQYDFVTEQYLQESWRIHIGKTVQLVIFMSL